MKVRTSADIQGGLLLRANRPPVNNQIMADGVKFTAVATARERGDPASFAVA
jgi:hypothetical protein